MSSRFYWDQTDVLAVAVRVIAGMRTWQDFGRKLTGSLLVELLAWTACLGVSLSRAAKLVGGPSDESVRKALHANLPELAQMRSEVSASLRMSLPRYLRRRAATIAIDYHKRPYYGEERKTPGVRGGQEEAGTRWFWTYATAAIVTHGERFTVALEPVPRGERVEIVLERLWQQMARIPLKIRLILLDREFCAADVLLWLRRHKVSYIMPLIRRGRFGRTRRKDQGNARFFRRGMRGIYHYQWQPRSSSRTRDLIRVRVACVPRGRRRPIVYLVSQPNWSLKWIQKMYETRFAIESTYRQLGQALAVTSTRNPSWRLLLVAIALLLRNVWVLCRELAIIPENIAFKTILLWIRSTIELTAFRPITGFLATHPPAVRPSMIV